MSWWLLPVLILLFFIRRLWKRGLTGFYFLDRLLSKVGVINFHKYCKFSLENARKKFKELYLVNDRIVSFIEKRPRLFDKEDLIRQSKIFLTEMHENVQGEFELLKKIIISEEDWDLFILLLDYKKEIDFLYDQLMNGDCIVSCVVSFRSKKK